MWWWQTCELAVSCTVDFPILKLSQEVKVCIITLITKLKRISNWPLHKMWYYEAYLINASKIWLFCIVHTNLSYKGKKKRFHVQNCLCGMIGEKIGYVLGLLVHGKMVVEVGRKVPSWLSIMKNIKYGANKHNRTCSSIFMHTKTPSVTI